jgi:serine protease
VLAVAASTRSGQRASYSNYGSAVAISAPGGATTGDAILSTLDGGLTVPLQDSAIGLRIGTSMATAHVAGVASLLLSRNPALTREQVVTALTGAASVTAFPANSNCAPGICGAGILNARLALASLEGVVEPPPAPSSGGGGAPGGWLLAGLLGYGALRRMRMRKPPQTAPASAP